MDGLNAAAIIDNVIEVRLELTTLKMALGVFSTCELALDLHPGSKDLQKEVSSVRDSVGKRIATILSQMDDSAGEFAQAKKIIFAEPVVPRIQ